MSQPTLDINLLDTYSLDSIAIVDISNYPANWITTTPTIEITPPGYPKVVLDFTPSSIQVYKSTQLGIACSTCNDIVLPDGIWTFKYSIYPSYKYYVERTFVRIWKLQSKLDEARISLDITECDEKIKSADKLYLSNVEDYLEGAVAAGNKCINKAFSTYYNKASDMLNQFINSKSCATR